MDKYNFTGFDRIESHYVMHSLDTPLYIWSHVPGPPEDKITVITEDQGRFPGFAQERFFYHFESLEKKYPGLKVNFEIGGAMMGDLRSLIQFTDSVINWPEQQIP